MKHSPGPWFIAKHSPRFRIIRTNGGLEIARSVKSQYFDLRPDDEQQSNLRLLAAAPDLLEAARMMADLVDDLLVQAGANYADELAAARAAIAKATGASA